MTCLVRSNPRAALQLYTVRESLKRDWRETIRQIGDLGFDGIELNFHGFQDWPNPRSLGQLVQYQGMQVCSGHVHLIWLEERLHWWMDYFRTLDCRDMVIHYVFPEDRKDEGAWSRFIERMRSIAGRLHEEGFRLSFHHHDHELLRWIGEERALEHLLKEIGPDRLQVELDTFFLQRWGLDPAAMIRRHAGRIPLLHLKDKHGDNGETRSSCNLGEGEIQWDEVFAEVRKAGVEWVIADQDHSSDEWRSAEKALRFFRAHVSQDFVPVNDP